VSQLVSLLGLAKAIDTRVGNEKARGLSGGEKKRLAIGCELIRWVCVLGGVARAEGRQPG
jgi:ABC-type multidrug transport system ATPase subunit